MRTLAQIQADNEICLRAWAGGLFDGEGCISIGYVAPSRATNRIVNPAYRLTVKLTMGHEHTVRMFGLIVGAGSFHKHVAESAKVNASYSWVAQARNGEKILKCLRQFLITKADEADVALEFCALPDGRTGGNGGSKPMPPSMMARRHSLYLKCCELKSRYRFRKNPIPAKPEAPKRKSKTAI